jgi:hypothetical protein
MVYHAEENVKNVRPTDRCRIGDVCLEGFSTWNFCFGPPYSLREMSDIYCVYPLLLITSAVTPPYNCLHLNPSVHN